MKKTWVQDASTAAVAQLIQKMSAQNLKKSPRGSRYVFGKPKSGKPDEKGIYFEDPTGTA